MPLHIFLCDDWFLLQEKRILNIIWKKEKKVEIFSLLSFWPEGPATSPLSGSSALISPGLETQGAQAFPLFALAQVQWAVPANKAAGPFAPLPTLFRWQPGPAFSLTATWGPHVSGIFFLLLVAEMDTPVESDAAPTTSWLVLHVEPSS
jgi:hypothetical protein